jgi:hypothetical protein
VIVEVDRCELYVFWEERKTRAKQFAIELMYMIQR